MTAPAPPNKIPFFRRLKTGFKQGIGIVLAALVIAYVFNAVNPDGIEWISKGPLASVEQTLRELGIKSISLDEAQKYFSDGNAVFLDTRSTDAFNDGHIPGAWNVRPETAADETVTLQSFSESGMEIIAYCDGIACSLSKEVAEILKEQGVDNVAILINGWTEWIRNGLPVEK